MDNYFEGIDFTKIEILLLLGVVVCLLPFIIFPVDYNITENEQLLEYQQLSEDKKSELPEKEKSELYDDAHEMILKEFDDEKYNETKSKIEKYLKTAELSILTPLELEITIYKELKSYEFQNRILFAFVIAMIILIFSVYLSRKGYTSYTPWLEKLANDKLAFDLQLYQHVDTYKIREFYLKTFKWETREDTSTRKKIGDIKIEDVFGWKPIDDDEKWYSVFTEKIDYRFYEIFFASLESEWGSKNYEKDTDSEGEYKAKPLKTENSEGREMNLYLNPELVPTKNNAQIKKALLAPISGNKNKTLLDEILKEMDIFVSVIPPKEKTFSDKIVEKIFRLKPEKIATRERRKVEKLMIRKIQSDLLYYSVMMNFRRGLVNATKSWREADELLRQSEEHRVSEDARDMDVGAQDLESTIQKIIKDLEDMVCTRRTTPKEGETKSSESKNASVKGMIADMFPFLAERLASGKENEETEDDIDDDVKKKINSIKEKMANRNKWNSDDWRAMGSIYYKWKEAGKGATKPEEEKKQGLTKVEKFWNWWNYTRVGRGLKKPMFNDPTEEYWKENRTVRAVNSLTKSFGYKIEEEPGNAVIFFGIVFGIIIAVALTNSLDILIGALQTPIDCGPLIENYTHDCFHADFFFMEGNVEQYQYLIILFLCFFPLGILFYHQGTILLSAKAAEQMTLGSEGLVFVNFLFILLQAIVVYFLAASIGDVTSFLSLLIVLVTIDALWVTIFTLNDMRDDVRDAPVFIEWIVFDIIIALFAGVFMINYASVPSILEENGWMNNWPIFVMLLAVLTTRAVVDYSYGWKNFWSKFAGAE